MRNNEKMGIVLIILGVLIIIIGCFNYYSSNRILAESWDINLKTTELIIHPDLSVFPTDPPSKFKDIKDGLHEISGHSLVLNAEIANQLNHFAQILVVLGIVVGVVGGFVYTKKKE